MLEIAYFSAPPVKMTRADRTQEVAGSSRGSGLMPESAAQALTRPFVAQRAQYVGSSPRTIGKWRTFVVSRSASSRSAVAAIR
jgi:hypothetical protein